MIVGIGTDIIEISRIKDAVLKSSEFIKKMFSEKEIQYFNSRNNRYEVIAGNFAAKEAVVKAMSTGFRDMAFQDVEILRDMLGKPYANLYNNAKAMIGDNCIIHVSISHCQEYATANAIIEALDMNGLEQVNYLSTQVDK